MTDSTKLMSERADEWRDLSIILGFDNGYKGARGVMIGERELERILLWHDKQKKLYADAMLERLEAQAQVWERVREDGVVSNYTHQTKRIDISAIESERQRTKAPSQEEE